MSITYIGGLVWIMNWLYQQAGMPFSPDEAKAGIEFIVNFAGMVMVFWGRWRAGGIKWFGVRKHI